MRPVQSPPSLPNRSQQVRTGAAPVLKLSIAEPRTEKAMIVFSIEEAMEPQPVSMHAPATKVSLP